MQVQDSSRLGNQLIPQLAFDYYRRDAETLSDLLDFLLRSRLGWALQQLGDALGWSEQFSCECTFNALTMRMRASYHKYRGVVPDVMPEGSGQSEAG